MERQQQGRQLSDLESHVSCNKTAFIIFLSVTALCFAQQPWSGILDPSRAADWTHAGIWNSYPLTGHGIPNRTTPCPLNASDTNYSSPSVIVNGTIVPSGRTDMTDANNINYALQQCADQSNPGGATNSLGNVPNPSVLTLGAGTFYIPGAVTFGTPSNNWSTAPGPFTKQANYVTLRGQGPDKTTLLAPTTGLQCGPPANAICMYGSNDTSQGAFAGYGGGCDWTAGYSQGTTILTLGNCVTQGAATSATAQQNGLPLQGSSMPGVGYHIVLDQRNDDIGLISCSSSGTTATCILSAPLPPTFAVGKCVAVSGVGNTAQVNVAAGTILSGQSGPQWPTGGYNIGMLLPVRFTGPAGVSTNPQDCATPGGILAIGTDSASGLPTFSYTLPQGGSNLATWYCGAQALGSTNPQMGRTNTVPSGATQAVHSCYATVDTGGIMVTGAYCTTTAGNCYKAGPSSLDGGIEVGRACPDLWFNGSNTTTRPWMHVCAGGYNQLSEVRWRSQQVVATVVACPTCAANQIAIDHPLSDTNWRIEQAPGIYWFRYYLHDVGVEGLTVNCMHDGGTQVNGIIQILHCYNCWVRNIRSLAGSRNHVWMYEGNEHIEFRDSYWWGNKRGSSQSYGIEFTTANSSVLIENNIFDHVVSAIMNTGSETVAAYNYQTDDGYNPTQNMMKMQSPMHSIYGRGLFEGNNTTGNTIDNVHGSMFGSITSFRERMRAQNVPVKTLYLNAFGIHSFQRGANIVGGVLGTSQTWPSIYPNSILQTLYQDLGYQLPYAAVSGCNRYIFCLGADSGQGGPGMADDHLVLDSLLRWGNYDVFTAAQTPASNGIRWCGSTTGSEAGCACTPNSSPTWLSSCSEIPGTFSFLHANSVPASHTLPPSFYLTAKPAWFVTPWGTPPWPPIGSDVTGGDNIFTNCKALLCGDDNSGHSYQLPAQLAYLNSPIDMSLADQGTVVTSATWTFVSPTGYITLNGTIHIDPYGTFRLQGSQPSGFDGIYNVSAGGPGIGNNGTNAPSPPAPVVTACGSTTYPCSASELPGGTRNDIVYQSYNYGLTALAGSIETRIGSTVRLSNQPVLSTGCQGGGNSPPGGTLQCTVRFASPAASGTAPAPVTDHYNVYMGIQSGIMAGIMCKQNATPILIGTPYFQQDAVIAAAMPDGVTPNPLCIQPPAINNTYATQIVAFSPINPCGTGTQTCTMQTMGTITYPYIRSFNADTSYGTGELPPQPSAAPKVINGNGKITGAGKIT